MINNLLNCVKTVDFLIRLCYTYKVMSHYSLEVRTLASHAEDPGSIPGGGAKKHRCIRICVFCYHPVNEVRQ